MDWVVWVPEIGFLANAKCVICQSTITQPLPISK